MSILRELNQRIAASCDALEAAGYVLTYRYDAKGWVDFMRRIMGAYRGEGPLSISPMYDPAHSVVGPQNFFWIEVLANELPAGVVCTRLFETEDLGRLAETWRLWWDRAPPQPSRPIGLDPHPMLRHLRGRIAFDGSYWIAPRHRGGPITDHLLQLLADLSVRNLEAEWRVCMVRRGDPARMERFCRNLHYQQRVPFINDFYPPSGKPQPYDLFVARAAIPDDPANRIPTGSHLVSAPQARSRRGATG